MRRSPLHQLQEHPAESHSTLAKVLAPEDVRKGDFVTLLHVITELPSFLWCAESWTLRPHELVRIQLVPEDGGIPMKVKSICLPFVLVKLASGDQRTLDLRHCRLARLDKAYARAWWKAGKKARRACAREHA